MGFKDKQARIAIDLVSTFGKTGVRLSDETRAKRESLRLEMKTLNADTRPHYRKTNSETLG